MRGFKIYVVPLCGKGRVVETLDYILYVLYRSTKYNIQIRFNTICLSARSSFIVLKVQIVILILLCQRGRSIFEFDKLEPYSLIVQNGVLLLQIKCFPPILLEFVCENYFVQNWVKPFIFRYN